MWELWIDNLVELSHLSKWGDMYPFLTYCRPAKPFAYGYWNECGDAYFEGIIKAQEQLDRDDARHVERRKASREAGYDMNPDGTRVV